MEELFRFSVVRPVSKTSATATTLASQPGPRGNTPPTPGQTFEAAIQAIVTNLRRGTPNEAIWAQLEQPAAAFLVASAAQIFADPLWDDLRVLVADLKKLGEPKAAKPTAATIKAVFTAHPGLTAAALIAYQTELSDLFLASMIVRRAGQNHLTDLFKQVPGLSDSMTVELADITLSINAARLALWGDQPLADAVAAGSDANAALFGAIATVLDATILLPAPITAALARPKLNAGFRELHVVRQHIRRYELAEIARIENVLDGEVREHRLKHSLSTEQDTFLQSIDTIENEKELDINDKVSIKNEADTQVKQDTKIDGGVHAQYDGPSFKLQTDLSASYARSDEKTRKYAAETAKEVTQKAVSKVTSQVTRSQTTKIIQKLVDSELQKFGNTTGKNIAGIYQWVQKVYLSQVFNLGRHLLIDITVPEPGANLLTMATSTKDLSPEPVQPHPLGTIVLDAASNPVLDQFGRQQLGTPLNPLDLSEKAEFNPGQRDPNFYGTWAARYGATGIGAPPPLTRTFSKGKSYDNEDDTDKSSTETIAIDDGYEGMQILVSASGTRNDNPGDGPIGQTVFIDVSVGTLTIHIPWPNSNRENTLSLGAAFPVYVTGNVEFTIYGRNLNQMAVNVQIIAQRTQTALDAWKLQTFEKIAASHRDLEAAYEAALAARRMATQEVGPLGAADPESNRAIERTELKRTCIAIFDNDNATVAGSNVMALNPAAAPAVADPSKPRLPEPVINSSQDLGARIRWFEQAFEWENVAYVLYPYFWGRRETWLTRFALKNDDPLFLNFLQAGYARVVVPVRIGFEKAVQFYLSTGLPWLGGDVPVVADDKHNPLYLDVADEIKALTGGGETHDLNEPVGEPWEYILPTNTIMLRDDGTLPEWHRIGLDGKENKAVPSDAPIAPWTWRSGAPT